MTQNASPLGRLGVLNPQFLYDTDDGGTNLYNVLTNMFKAFSDNLLGRWSGEVTLANNATATITHNFGLDLAKLKVLLHVTGIQQSAAEVAAKFVLSSVDGNSFTVQNVSGGSLTFQVLTLGLRYGITSADFDPAVSISTSGDISAQNVTVAGHLIVNGQLTFDGTATRINTTDLEVEDKNITVNNGGTTAAATGAGLAVEGDGGAIIATIQYDPTLPSKWKLGAAGSEAEVVTVSNAQMLTNKSVDKLRYEHQAGAIASPGSGSNDVVLVSRNKKLYSVVDDGTGAAIEKEVGSGAGGGGLKNYVLRSDAEDFSAGALATADIVVSGASLAVTQTAGQVLRGTKSFKLDFSAAAQTVDFLCSALDAVELQGLMQIAFDSKMLSGSLGAIECYLFDGTSDLAPLNKKVPTGTQREFSTTVRASSSASVRVRFKSTAAASLVVDNVRLNPALAVISAGDAYPEAYSPTWTGVTISSQSFSTERHKGYARIKGTAVVAGVPTGAVKFTLPNSLTIQYSAPGFANSDIRVGEANVFGAGHEIGIVKSDGTSPNVLRICGDDGELNWDADTPIDWAAGNRIEIDIEVPIAEYQGGIATVIAPERMLFLTNTNSSVANDTTSFARSTDGVLFPDVSGTGVSFTKDVELPRDFQPTDKCFLAVFAPGQTIPQDHIELYPRIDSGITEFGMSWTQQSTSRARITFHAGGAEGTGTTWKSLRDLGWRWAFVVDNGLAASATSGSTSSGTTGGGSYTHQSALALTDGGILAITTDGFQTWAVAAGGALPVTLSTTPFGGNAPASAIVITLVGTDSAKAVIIPAADIAKGPLINGDSELGRGATLTVQYSPILDRYIELSRTTGSY